MEDNYLEKQPIIKAETVSRKHFLDSIYKGKSLPQDPRFLTTEEGGVFKYLDLSELIGIFAEKTERFFPVVEVNGQIVGISELQVNPNESNVVWIKHVSVDPKYQGNHYASKVIEEIFRFAKEKGYSLEASSYTNVGYEKLKKVCNAMSEKYGVVFKDTEGRIG